MNHDLHVAGLLAYLLDLLLDPVKPRLLLYILMSIRGLLVYVSAHGALLSIQRLKLGFWYALSAIAYIVVCFAYIMMFLVGTPWYLQDFLNSYLAFLRDIAWLLLMVSHIRGVTWGSEMVADSE